MFKTTMMMAVLTVCAVGCGGTSLVAPEGPAPASVASAMAGCWEPIASENAPPVEWVGGTGFSTDGERLYVAWRPGQKIGETSFAAAVDAYFQLEIASRPDLSAEHVANCEVYLRATGL